MRFLASVGVLAILLAAGSARAVCWEEGCTIDLDEVLPCAEIVAIVECDVGGIGIGDFHVIDAIRGVEPGAKLRVFSFGFGPGWGTSPPFVLPGERRILAATRTGRRESKLLRHFTTPVGDGPPEVVELASRGTDEDARWYLALDRKAELGTAVREYLALPTDEQRRRRVRARIDDVICARDFGEANGKRDEVCAAVHATSTPEEALEALGYSEGGAFWRARLKRTLASDESQCREAANRDTELEPPVRDLRSLLAPWGRSGMDVSLETVQSFVATLDPRRRAATLIRMLASKSEAVRAVAAAEAPNDGRTKEWEAVWTSLRSRRSVATGWLALARARRGDKAAMDVLADGLSRTEDLSAVWAMLQREALVLLTNSAARARIPACVPAKASTAPCVPLGPSTDLADVARWWRENRGRMPLFDAWPGLVDVPFRGYASR